MQINSTEAAGFIAFVPAALASAAAFGATKKNTRGARTGWAVIAAVYALLGVEILENWRHRFDFGIRDWLRAEGIYSDRRPVQVLLLLVIGVIALFIARRFLGRAPTPQLRLARAATAALVLLFVVEYVSLHQVGDVLYRPVGPIMLIAWLWLACGWTTTVAAAGTIRP